MEYSDFAIEAEMLFVATINRLVISGLSLMDNDSVYDEWVIAIRAIQLGFMEGEASREQISHTHKQKIFWLMDDGLNKINDRNNNKEANVPQYISSIFQNILQKRKWIQINIGCLNADKWLVQDNGDVWYGYNGLQDHYLNDRNAINFNVIKSLYPSLSAIYIVSTERIKNKKNGLKFVESIIVNDDTFNNIYSYLSTTQTMNFIAIINPKNDISMIQKYINKYQPSYGKIHFKIKLGREAHPVGGSCDTVEIVRLLQ